MKIDWVPYSAAALVSGSVALAMGGLLMPTIADPADSLRIVLENDGRWLAVSAMYFGAAIAMTLGLPTVLTLLGTRGARRGMLGAALLAVGFIGTAGYAMLLVFFRALALEGAIDEGGGLGILTRDVGLGSFLYVWIAAFYLGELLLAWGLLLARSVPRWVPALLILHVLSLPVSLLLPGKPSSAAVLLVALGFCGIGITASDRVRPAH